MNYYGIRPLITNARVGRGLLHAVTVRPGQSLLVGRGDHCDLRLRLPRISTEHFLVFSRDSGWFVRDLDSRNGTMVNDEFLEVERVLSRGDEIRAGDVSFDVNFVTMLDRLVRWMLPMSAINATSMLVRPGTGPINWNHAIPHT